MDYRLAKRRRSLTPEELVARGRLARFRFRSAVRFVINNLYWLLDVEGQELTDNVQGNIFLLTRRKDQKSLLTIKDKLILSKPVERRSEEEKMHLDSIIGNLKCFRRYPKQVKNQLAGVTYFFYYGPDRDVVKQGREAHSLYFVITGKVTVWQEVYDPILDTMERQDILIMGPGSLFGEVSLLHDIPRTATVTTKTHAELLCLKKEDFNSILKATMKQQWDYIQNAMKSFSYFDDWDEISLRECCLMAKLKSFVPDETIIGDDTGLPDNVYFVIKGRCRMIEHLLVIPTFVANKKRFRLYEPPVMQQEILPLKSNPQISNKELDRNSKNVDSKTSAATKQSQQFSERKSSTGSKTVQTNKSESKSKVTLDINDASFSKRSKEDNENAPLKNIRSEDQMSSYIKPTNIPTNDTRKSEQVFCYQMPSNVETFFVQVCYFGPTACFSIGENLNNRRIVAITYTECLLIPRYWLLQRNKGNIWNRIKQFLDNRIPSTKQVFRAFVDQRRWLAYRKKIVDDVLHNKKMFYGNVLANVPYSIRVKEQLS